MFLYSFSSAEADVVHLNNGDRITGSVSMEKPGALTVKTEYAGKISVDLEQVTGVDTDESLAIETSEGARKAGVLEYSDGAQRLGGGAGWESLDLAKVQRMNADEEALEEAIKKANRTWKGGIGSGLVFRSGEKDTFDATLDFEFVRTKPSDVLTLKLNAAYGETEKELDTQRLYGEGKWQFYPGERFFYFGVISGEHDQPRRLQLRTTGGAGVGYDVIKNKKTLLSLDGGFDYVYERWENYGPGKYREALAKARVNAFDDLRSLAQDLSDGTVTASPRTLLDAANLALALSNPDLKPKVRTEDYITARLGMRYEQKLFKDSQLSDELSVSPNLNDLGHVRLTNKLAFTTPFSESLSLRAQLRTEFDSEPGTSVEEFDHTLTLGVRWDY